MNLYKRISTWVDVVSRWTGIVSAILMGLIAFIASYEVVMRFVFRNPSGWTIEFIPFLILWGTFLGGALTLKEDRHIKVDLVTCHLPLKARKILKMITEGIGFLFCLILFVKGIGMVMQTKGMGTVTPGTLRIPVYIPQLCVPIGAILLSLQFLVIICEDIVSLRRGERKSEEGATL